MDNKKIGLILKIIAAIYLMGAVLDFLVGLGLFFAKDAVIKIFPAYLANYGAILGIVQLCLAGLGLAVGLALLRNRRWAVVAVIILGIVQIIASLSEMATAGHGAGTLGKSVLKIAWSVAVVVFLSSRKVQVFLNEKRQVAGNQGPKAADLSGETL